MQNAHLRKNGLRTRCDLAATCATHPEHCNSLQLYWTSAAQQRCHPRAPPRAGQPEHEGAWSGRCAAHTQASQLPSTAAPAPASGASEPWWGRASYTRISGISSTLATRFIAARLSQPLFCFCARSSSGMHALCLYFTGKREMSSAACAGGKASTAHTHRGSALHGGAAQAPQSPLWR